MTIPPTGSLTWISVCKNAPYFEDEQGNSWTPIGQNDAILWPELQGLFRRQNVGAVEQYFAYQSAHGVTCMRLMMEYCQTENRYLEKPAGRFQPNMVQLWDDIFSLCERYHIRLLLTPFDTFWMARRWKFHPYNKINGGPCSSKFKWLSCPAMLDATKNRFSFFIERWGKSGVIFGWDLWNEINPNNAAKSMAHMNSFVDQISGFVRSKELSLYNKSHLQTVSVFAPHMRQHDMTNLVFQHPMLDFSSTHFYDSASMDSPVNTHLPAASTGNMVKDALMQLVDNRPFFDSEHGPINYFKRNKKGLPDTFDAAYFSAVQWAHLASGAAGGGMRWPYRHPHELTHEMRLAQKNLAGFTKLIDWKIFNRRNLNEHLRTDFQNMYLFGCGDRQQAIIYIIHKPKKKAQSDLKSSVTFSLIVPGLTGTNFKIHFWDTNKGLIRTENILKASPDLQIEIELPGLDLAIAIRSLEA